MNPGEQLVVELYVADLDRSLAFYQALGFELQRRTGGFAVLTWDGCQLFLDERPDISQQHTLRSNVRVLVDDVDARWKQCRDLGCQFASDIEDREYGLRDFIVLDPDGFGVRFATRL